MFIFSSSKCDSIEIDCRLVRHYCPIVSLITAKIVLWSNEIKSNWTFTISSSFRFKNKRKIQQKFNGLAKNDSLIEKDRWDSFVGSHETDFHVVLFHLLMRYTKTLKSVEFSIHATVIDVKSNVVFRWFMILVAKGVIIFVFCVSILELFSTNYLWNTKTIYFIV